ncbi:hypothetical protein ABW21_db0207173 [Orbilia brochopaga]|nr:hypothetical protein ABW21_db0207173 [Drechslerella brochopaga]
MTVLASQSKAQWHLRRSNTRRHSTQDRRFPFFDLLTNLRSSSDVGCTLEDIVFRDALVGECSLLVQEVVRGVYSLLLLSGVSSELVDIVRCTRWGCTRRAGHGETWSREGILNSGLIHGLWRTGQVSGGWARNEDSDTWTRRWNRSIREQVCNGGG